MQKARRHPRPASGDAGQAPTACMHTVSGSISLAVRRSFHLSLTVLFTIGHGLVFSLGRWSSRIQPGFHVSRPTRGPHRIAYLHFAYGTLTLCGRTFQYRSAMRRFSSWCGPTTPGRFRARVWAPPVSLAATLGISLDFCSSRYLDVSVPWVGSLAGDGIAPAGFPHSDTPGSSLACSSPRLFAACHVLRRRSVPRHPPYALTRLTSPRVRAGRAPVERSARGRPSRFVRRARPPSPFLHVRSGRALTGQPERPKALVLPSTHVFKHRTPDPILGRPCRPPRRTGQRGKT